MNDKAKFAVKILKQYAKEAQVLPRSTSDLSKLEEYLILKLFDKENEAKKNNNFWFTIFNKKHPNEVKEILSNPTKYINNER